MRRKPRKLTQDERAVWTKVTETMKPLRADQPPAGPVPVASGGLPVTPPHPGPPRPQPRRIVTPEPATRVQLSPDPMEAVGKAAPTMDAKAFGRMKRGKLVPEARIDLHGMTADRAHGALRGFVMDAHARGLRLVLVITGKGRSAEAESHLSPARRGILRNAVPLWLAQPPLNTMILQLAPAHQRHGGGGAYYVYLRRRR